MSYTIYKVMRAALGTAIVSSAIAGGTQGVAEIAMTDSSPAYGAPLISRQLIFGNPENSAVRVSPDGTMLSFLRPVAGVINLWVAPIGAPSNARPVTALIGRGIAEYRWAANSRNLLYLRDDSGNENFQLYSVAVKGGVPVDLTRNAAVRTVISRTSSRHPDEVLVGFNDRDPRYHDLYRVNVHTAARQLVARGDGYVEMMADDDLRPRLAKTADPDGGYSYHSFIEGKWRPILRRPIDDAFSAAIIGYRAAHDDALLVDSFGTDKAGLIALNLTTGAVQTLARGKNADLSHVLTSEVTGSPLAVSEEFLVRSWSAVDTHLAADIAAIDRQLGRPYDIVSHSKDGAQLVLRISAAGHPETFALWERKAQKLTTLFNAYPKLATQTLATMRPVLINARDGLRLVSYLTLPVGADSDGDGVPERPVPLVLSVHGGPWWRDSLEYVPEHQWLANRGYAVLSVNFRGSTGLGKKFLNAGDGEWAGKMHNDLIDAVDWAIESKIADRSKVAIYGLSYGGYSALVGLTFTPKVFACAVDMSGPVNLVTTFQTTPPYWVAFREQLKRRVGNVDTEDGRAFLLSRSPNMFADQVQRPLLIGQGLNDPRVKKAEPDQMVAALKARKIPVTYVVYADEGHVLQRPENRISFFAMADGFYGKCLGGRVEPTGGDYAGALFKIVEDAGEFASPDVKAK